MSATVERPVAFYHQDGLVAAWKFASKYAGQSGHVATLPEIIELRLGAKPGPSDSPWENWYTSSSAEYVGVGADGRVKIIVAHDVGPMSTIDGIKAAYKWEWGDKTRRNSGGRITAQQFLDLEAGRYGTVKVVGLWSLFRPGGKITRKFDIADVNVLDFEDYVNVKRADAFSDYLTARAALHDPLLRMRLGANGYRYLMKHERIAKAYHQKERPNDRFSRAQGFDDRDHPYITKMEDAPNCPYVLSNRAIREATGNWAEEARVPEEGYAFAHLLDIDGFMNVHTQEVGVGLMTSPGVHEWWNGAKFIAVPEDASLDGGLTQGPDPVKVIRTYWENFMEPVDDGYVPITPFLLERYQNEWFACYPKKFPDEDCMDTTDAEFHVRLAERAGEDGTFTTNDMFFLRYSLSQVKNIMPRGANAYEVVDISTKDAQGLTTVTVRFYQADVDTTRRLPRTNVIARDYDRLTEVYL